jgi:hypothetical protein
MTTDETVNYHMAVLILSKSCGLISLEFFYFFIFHFFQKKKKKKQEYSVCHLISDVSYFSPFARFGDNFSKLPKDI